MEGCLQGMAKMLNGTCIHLLAVALCCEQQCWKMVRGLISVAIVGADGAFEA